MVELEEFIGKLHELEVFKLGDFVLKSGFKSPIYVDLRELISSPSLMKNAAEQLVALIQNQGLEYDYIVGVPYAALPLGTLVSLNTQTPMLMKRKDAKAYGTKKLVEGKYKPGGRALIVEDVVSTGASIIETVDVLRAEGLVVTDVVCVLDREQGGRQALEKTGINLHGIVKVDSILAYLQAQNKISAAERARIDDALKNPVLASPVQPKSWRLEDRIPLFKHPFNQKLAGLMVQKRTNLCVALDLPKAQQILAIAEQVKDNVIAVKLHYDTIEDFGPEFVQKLTELADSAGFVVFEDRKFADTGNTNQLQLSTPHPSGAPPIARWAHLATVHAVAGAEAVRALWSGPTPARLQAVLVIAQLSTRAALTQLEGYASAARQLAHDNAHLVAGFIGQTRDARRDDPAFLYWSPGVNAAQSTDGKGQQWRSVHKAIVEDGNDIIIVGRGITQADDPKTAAQSYAEAGWSALQQKR